MAAYTPKLAKVAKDVLEPGETLLAGARAMTKGATKSIIAGAAGAVAGGAAGVAVAGAVSGKEAEEGRKQAKDAGLGDAAQVAVGLTDRRLLVWKRSGLSGKAKDLIGEIPVSRIAKIEGRDSGSKLKPDDLSVGLSDGSTVDFEVVTADGYEGIARAFEGLSS